MQLRVGCDVLPTEQEAHEVGRRNRLDLAAQAPEGEMMDAREEAALAPFDGRGYWRASGACWRAAGACA